MMCDRERIVRGARYLGLPVNVYGDGPGDTRPPRSPAPGIAVMYADVEGREEDILAAFSAGVALEHDADDR